MYDRLVTLTGARFRGMAMRASGRVSVFAGVTLSLVLLVTACGSSPSDGEAAGSPSVMESPTVVPSEMVEGEGSSEAESQEEQPEGDGEDSGSIDVNRGLLSVEVTIPADFFSMTSETARTQEEIEADLRASGYSAEVTVNDDGSVTYRMSRGEYSRFLDETKASVEESIQEIIGEEPGIFESVTYSDDLRRFTVIVNRGPYESSFAGVSLGFGLLFGGALYQAFAGTAPDDIYVIVETVDASTGKVFNTYDSREDDNVSLG